MTEQSKIIRSDTVVTLLLAGLTTLIMGYIHLNNGIPLSGLDRIAHILLFPSAMVVFHLFTVFAASPDRKELAEKFDQWNGLWIFPFFITGLSWDYWESWQVVSALFFALYIAFRLIGFIYFRQPHAKLKPVNMVDAAAFFCGLFLVNIYSQTGPSEIPVYQGLVAAIAVTAIGYLSILSIEEYAAEGFRGSLWQRFFMFVFCFSLPFSGMLTQIDLNIIPVLGVLLFFAYRKNNSVWAHAVSLTGAGIVIGTSSVIDTGLIPLCVWMTSLVIIGETSQKKKNQALLINSGFMVLLIASMLVTYINARGQFPGVVIYPFPTWIAWVGILFSRENGIIPAAPWTLLAISGWLISIKSKDLNGIVLWLGWPLILSGIVISAWMQTGTTPGLISIMIPVVCLLPFIGSLWPVSPRTLLAGITRMFLLLSLSISLIFWVFQQAYQAHMLTIGRILESLASRSGMELYKLLPLISHAFPIVTPIVIQWTYISAGSILLLLISTRIKAIKVDIGAADLLVFFMIVILAGFGIRSARVWYSVPLETEIVINSGKSWEMAFELPRSVTAIELETRLSRSTYLSQGETIAEIYSGTGDSMLRIGDLRAGVDTAEWAYDRKDVLSVIKHNRPEISRTWVIEERDGSSYQGHSYRGFKLLPSPVIIENLMIKNVMNPEYNIPISISNIRLSLALREGTWQEPYQLIKGENIELSTENSLEGFRVQDGNRYSGIIIDGFLENATEVEQGKVVGQVMIKGKEDVSMLWLIRAGIDTAEWSLDRPDMVGRVAHTHAAYSMSTRRSQGESNFLAHNYRSRWSWDPAFEVTEIALEILLKEETYPDTKWICSEILIY